MRKKATSYKISDDNKMHTLIPLAIMYSLIVICVKMEDDCSYIAQKTAEEVPDCPRNETQYAERKRLKQCEKWTTRCRKATYHCVVNPFMNATIETCAPPAFIFGSVCAEINMGERPIQGSRHQKAKCKKCPDYYTSINAYKYPECYDAVKREKTDENATEETGFKEVLGIVVIVLIMAILIIPVSIYLLRRKRKRKRKTKLKANRSADGIKEVESLRSSTDGSESIQMEEFAHPKDCQLANSVQTKREMNPENRNTL